ELDIVHRERIPCEQRLDVAAADEPAEVLDAARVHDNGPGDERDAAAGGPHVPHHGRDFSHAHFDATLGRDVVGHEREPETVALAEIRRDADAVHAADDQIVSFH